MVTVSSGSAPEPGRSATSTLWLDGRRRSGTRLRCPTPRPGTACEPGDLATRSRPRCRGQIGSPLSVAASTVGIAGPLFMAELRRSEVSALRWADCPPRGQTHGLPPQSGPVTADTPLSAMPRSTVPAGGTRRARHAVRPEASACRSSRLARGGSTVENAVGRAAAGLAVGHADGRPRSTPGSTSRPTTAAASPGRSPRPPSSGTGSAPPPAARGRRRMADAPSAPSGCGKRGQQVRRWLERRG